MHSPRHDASHSHPLDVKYCKLLIFTQNSCHLSEGLVSNIFTLKKGSNDKINIMQTCFQGTKAFTSIQEKPKSTSS